MAKRTIVRLIDDLDGSEAEQSIDFAFRGTAYEIDLSGANAAAFEAAIAPYMNAARRRTGGGAPRQPRIDIDRPPLDVIRAWAKQNGYEISNHGRVPNSVYEAYKAQNADSGKRSGK